MEEQKTKQPERRRILRIAKNDAFYKDKELFNLIGRVGIVTYIDHKAHAGPYVGARIKLNLLGDESRATNFYKVLLSKPLTENNEETNGEQQI